MHMYVFKVDGIEMVRIPYIENSGNAGGTEAYPNIVRNLHRQDPGAKVGLYSISITFLTFTLLDSNINLILI